MALSRKRWFALVVAGLLLSAAQATAEVSAERHGLVTTGPCPLTCEQFGLTAANCRQWESATSCHIEDFTQPPGHRSMARVREGDFVAPPSAQTAALGAASGRRGLVTSAQCPYSCRQARLPKESCREWSDGERCYVEDFTQPAGHRSLIRVP